MNNAGIFVRYVGTKCGFCNSKTGYFGGKKDSVVFVILKMWFVSFMCGFCNSKSVVLLCFSVVLAIVKVWFCYALVWF
jgi:hypothetical protein